jgi:plastocyanin
MTTRLLPRPSPVPSGPLRRGVAILALLALALTSAASGQSTVTVDQVGDAFVPADITVDAGDTVRWLWSSGVRDVLEGVDELVDPTDAFYGPLTAAHPQFDWTFDTKFLFEHPRPGHVYDYACTLQFLVGMVGTVTVQSPWTNLLNPLPGTIGTPLLWGSGPLTAGSNNTLSVQGAAPSGAAMLFVGLSEGNAPFKGGTLVPIPFVLQVALATDPGGGLSLPFVWPAGLSGVPVIMQLAVQDAGAVQGVALSNALRALGS